MEEWKPKPTVLPPEMQTLMRLAVCRACGFRATGRRDSTINGAMADHKERGCPSEAIDLKVGA